MGDHSRLAASAANQWINCPGSIAYIEQLQQQGIKLAEASAGAAAAGKLGTACHSVLEYAVLKKIKPTDIRAFGLKRLSPDVPLTYQNLKGVELYWQYIMDKTPLYDHTFVERKYLLSKKYGVDVGGTADITQCKKRGNLHIGDYKNGRTFVGVDSYQLKVYAVGAYYELNPEYKFTDVSVSIGQPNAGYHIDGSIRADNFAVSDLLAWEKEILAPAIKKIKAKSLDLNPGEKQCGWCPARLVCVANTKQVLSTAQLDFADCDSGVLKTPEIKSLTKKQMIFILDNKDRIINLIHGVEQHVEKLLHAGERMGAYKLEIKTGNRKLLPEKDLASVLKPYKITLAELKPEQPAKLLGITDLEKYLAKVKKWDAKKISKFMEQATTRSASAPVLAKTVSHSAQKDFIDCVEFEDVTPKKEKRLNRVSTRTSKIIRQQGQRG